MTPRNLTSTSVLICFCNPRASVLKTLELPNLFVNDPFVVSNLQLKSLFYPLLVPPYLHVPMDFETVSPQKMRVKTLGCHGCHLDVHPSKWKMVGFLDHQVVPLFRPSRTSIHHHLSYHAAFSLVVHSFRPPVQIVSGCRESSIDAADELVQVLVLYLVGGFNLPL